jgi:hypothetical protein
MAHRKHGVFWSAAEAYGARERSRSLSRLERAARPSGLACSSADPRERLAFRDEHHPITPLTPRERAPRVDGQVAESRQCISACQVIYSLTKGDASIEPRLSVSSGVIVTASARPEEICTAAAQSARRSSASGRPSMARCSPRLRQDDARSLGRRRPAMTSRSAPVHVLVLQRSPFATTTRRRGSTRRPPGYCTDVGRTEVSMVSDEGAAWERRPPAAPRCRSFRGAQMRGGSPSHGRRGRAFEADDADAAHRAGRR